MSEPARFAKVLDLGSKVGTAVDGFIALINALAWPSATMAIAILFRRELRMALARLGQLKYGGMELTFREDLRQAETLARSIPRPRPTPERLPIDPRLPSKRLRGMLPN